MCLYCALIKCPKGSHQVPNVFLKIFQIRPHFCPICFAQSCDLFTYIANPKGRFSHIYTWSVKTAFGSLTSFNNFLVMGSQNGSLKKKSSHTLITVIHKWISILEVSYTHTQLQTKPNEMDILSHWIVPNFITSSLEYGKVMLKPR
jgi:hypothetical protein